MAILVSLLTTSAHALDGLIECPAGNEALPRVTETSYGVPLAETFAMDIAGRSLEVPIGFLSPWPPQKFYKNQPFRSPMGYNFSFWMPDGRAPEIDTYWNVMNRPCEAGRGQADEGRYTVDVKYRPLPAGGLARSGRFDDDFLLSVLKDQHDFESNVQVTRRGDMIEIRPGNYQIYYFLSAPDAPFDAVVKCSKTTQLPNVACIGDIRFHEDDYALQPFIPRDSVNGFEQAAWLAKRLIESWEVPNGSRP